VSRGQASRNPTSSARDLSASLLVLIPVAHHRVLDHRHYILFQPWIYACLDITRYLRADESSRIGVLISPWDFAVSQPWNF
jgi:hypothetical protein